MWRVFYDAASAGSRYQPALPWGTLLVAIRPETKNLFISIPQRDVVTSLLSRK